MRRYRWLLSGSTLMLAVPALAQAPTGQSPSTTPVSAQDTPEATTTEDIVVTAQKRAESVQDVPIAVSAFGEEALRDRGIDGAGKLVLSVPNLVFQQRPIRSSLQIRGVGTQLVSIAGDDGVGVHTNNAPLLINRVGEAEFYDVERVEVLRGPQGTLFGRSATGGVINVVTNKPTHALSSALSAEVGNYGNMRLFGHVNLPLGNHFSLRFAGFGLLRDGYTTNTLTGDDVDGRAMWSTRVTLSYDGGGPARAFAMWERFRENDDRGARKQLCLKDPGLTTVGGVATGAAQAAFTQGCSPRDVYASDVYGATNQLATFAGILGRQLGIQPVDSFAGKTISRDLREVELVGRSIFRARSDVIQYNAEIDLTDALTLSSLSSYSENRNYNRGDTTGGYPTVPFPRTALAPNGTVTSGQLGTSDRLQTESIQETKDKEFSQELRLQSDLPGPLNFSVGGIYLRYKVDFTTYINANILDTIARAQNRTLATPIYIDPLANPDYTGHNYFTSISFYDLKSTALFGELYYDVARDLRFTLGLRYTDDRKQLTGSGSTLLVPGGGLILTAPQSGNFRALTGRVNLQYSPQLAFTDKTMIFASAARGYKGGGFNTPGVVALGLPARFEPEFVNGLELGTKNTLAGGRATINLTGFYYDYSGYQISRSVNRATFVENVNTRIYGAEFEGVVEPLRNLRLNANIGYLKSEITEGSAVDTFYRTQGDPTYIYGNSTSGGCILNAAGVAAALAVPGGATALANTACSGPTAQTARFVALGIPASTAAALAAGINTFGPNVARYANGSGEGLIQNLDGNSLPSAPKFTISAGAQYSVDIDSSWNATLRGDYYRQSASFSRYNNAFFDRIRAWENVNATLTFDNARQGLTVQLYVKNALNKDTIINSVISDENLGAARNIVLLDPRLYGVLLTKRF